MVMPLLDARHRVLLYSCDKHVWGVCSPSSASANAQRHTSCSCYSPYYLLSPSARTCSSQSSPCAQQPGSTEHPCPSHPSCLFWAGALPVPAWRQRSPLQQPGQAATALPSTTMVASTTCPHLQHLHPVCHRVDTPLTLSANRLGDYFASSGAQTLPKTHIPLHHLPQLELPILSPRLVFFAFLLIDPQRCFLSTRGSLLAVGEPTSLPRSPRGCNPSPCTDPGVCAALQCPIVLVWESMLREDVVIMKRHAVSHHSCACECVNVSPK